MLKKSLIGIVCSAAAASSGALTLGQLTGDVVIGQPLRLRLQISGQDHEFANSLCPVVRVRHGEDLLPSTSVSVFVRNETDRATLNIESRQPVAEPYVHVEAVVGCGNQVSRRYTVLSELPVVGSAKEPNGNAPVGTKAQATRSVRSPELAHARVSELEPVRAPLQSADASKAGAVRDRAETRVDKTARSINKKEQPSSSKSSAFGVAVDGGTARLHLDPLELVSSAEASVPKLRLSGEAGTLLVEQEVIDEATKKRREAAKALWAVLNGAPEDIAAEQAKAKLDSQQNKQLQASLSAAQQAQQVAQQQALNAEDAIYTHPVTLGLLGLLVALVGAWLYQRQRASRGQGNAGEHAVWWRPAAKPQNKDAARVKVAFSQRVKRVLQSTRAVWDRIPFPGRRGRTDSGDSKLSTFDQLAPHKVPDPRPGMAEPSAATEAPPAFMLTRPPVGPHTDFANSTLLDGGRSVATEELLDLQQQVEFFISLGQADQAVEVLLTHLADSSEPSPLAYLDLLKLYHELGRKSEYDSLRTEFNRIFRGGAPEFDKYEHSRRGLERYDAAMSRIQALWPRPEVLDLIERSIFRHEHGELTEAFDLEAYRELLLLYAVARELVAEDGLDSPSTGLVDLLPPADVSDPATVLQPLSAAFGRTHRVEDGTNRVGADGPAHGLSPLGISDELDLDLSQFPDDALNDIQPALGSGTLDFELPDDPVAEEGHAPLTIAVELAEPVHSDVMHPSAEPLLELTLDDMGSSKFTIRKAGSEKSD